MDNNQYNNQYNNQQPNQNYQNGQYYQQPDQNYQNGQYYQQPNQNYQNGQYYQQLNQNYQNAQNMPLDQKEKNKLTIAGVLLVVGFFFAGIICGVAAIILSQQVSKKSTAKNVITIIGAIEIALVVIALVA